MTLDMTMKNRRTRRSHPPNSTITMKIREGLDTSSQESKSCWIGIEIGVNGRERGRRVVEEVMLNMASQCLLASSLLWVLLLCLCLSRHHHQRTTSTQVSVCPSVPSSPHFLTTSFLNEFLLLHYTHTENYGFTLQHNFTRIHNYYEGALLAKFVPSPELSKDSDSHVPSRAEVGCFPSKESNDPMEAKVKEGKVNFRNPKKSFQDVQTWSLAPDVLMG